MMRLDTQLFTKKIMFMIHKNDFYWFSTSQLLLLDFYYCNSLCRPFFAFTLSFIHVVMSLLHFYEIVRVEVDLEVVYKKAVVDVVFIYTRNDIPTVLQGMLITKRVVGPLL